MEIESLKKEIQALRESINSKETDSKTVFERFLTQ